MPIDILKSSENSLRIGILITPLRNGLFNIKVLQSLADNISYSNSLLIIIVNKIYAPLFNGAVVNRKWLPFLIKISCITYIRYLKIDSIETYNATSLKSQRTEYIPLISVG